MPTLSASENTLQSELGTGVLHMRNMCFETVIDYEALCKSRVGRKFCVLKM